MTHLLRRRRFFPLFMTQLLGAMNDNVFKSALVVMVAFRVAASEASVLVNVAGALLILPFFLFSATAGQLADRFEKSRLIRILKLTELCVMLLAAAGFYFDSTATLFVALFLMGTQSAFFGPLKYGILPQHLKPSELQSGNGLIEMGTFVGILVGTIVGGGLLVIPGGASFAALLLIALAVFGVVSSRFVPEAKSVAINLRVDRNPIRAFRATLQVSRRDKRVWWSILLSSWFWFTGAFLLAQFPLFAQTVLHGDELVVTALMTVFSVGVGVGSIACERLAPGRPELALVPLAGAGIAVFLGLFALTSQAAGATGALLTLSTVPLWVYVTLLFLGVSGGLFIVPLYAFMQAHARPSERSQVIAGNNIVNALFMVASAVVAIALRALGLTFVEMFLVLAGVNLMVAARLGWGLRRSLLRFFAEWLVKIVYRLRVTGLDQLPEEGPALLVANHPSFFDAFIVGGICKRPTRFVVHHKTFRWPVIGWMFRLARAIPIAPAHEDAKCLADAYDAIDEALENGEIVMVFPEGKVTRDGALNPFRKGVEQILARRAVPVIPIAIEGMWGSFFSHAHGTGPMRGLPRRLKAKVEVRIGEAFVGPATTTLRAEQLEQSVAGLLNYKSTEYGTSVGVLS